MTKRIPIPVYNKSRIPKPQIKQEPLSEKRQLNLDLYTLQEYIKVQNKKSLLTSQERNRVVAAIPEIVNRRKDIIEDKIQFGIPVEGGIYFIYKNGVKPMEFRKIDKVGTQVKMIRKTKIPV